MNSPTGRRPLTTAPTPTGPSGRGRGRPRVLSDDDVADAALTVAREHGIVGLSMRAVARQLDVAPMTVYGYVANKQALHALVIDRILSQVRVPEPDEGPWEQRLRLLLCDARRILVERRPLADGRNDLGGNAVELLQRGAFGREASRLADGVVDLLREARFEPDDIDVCFAALFTYVTGNVDPTNTSVADEAPTPIRKTAGRPRSDHFRLGLQALIEGLKLTLGSAPPPAE